MVFLLTNTGFSNPHRYKKFRNDALIPHNAEGAGNIWLAADRGDLDLVKQYVYVFLECVCDLLLRSSNVLSAHHRDS